MTGIFERLAGAEYLANICGCKVVVLSPKVMEAIGSRFITDSAKTG